MDTEATRASGPEAYHGYVEDTAGPVGNEGRRERHPAWPNRVSSCLITSSPPPQPRTAGHRPCPLPERSTLQIIARYSVLWKGEKGAGARGAG